MIGVIASRLGSVVAQNPISTALAELLAGLADAACPADIARLEGVVWSIQVEADDVAYFLNEGIEAPRIA